MAAAAVTDDPWSNSFIEDMREEEGGGMGIEQTREGSSRDGWRDPSKPIQEGEKNKSGCRNDSPPAHEIPKEPDRKRTQQRAGAFLEVVAQFTTRHKSSLFPSLVTPTPPLTLSPKLLALFTTVCSLADYNRVNSSSSYYSSVGSCSF